MSSLVEELQAAALNSSVPASALLQRAKVVAYKLDLSELLQWVEKELNGYKSSDELPRYRETVARVQAFDPRWGWKPVLFSDPRVREILSKPAKIRDSADRMEEFIRGDKDSTMFIPLPLSLAEPIMHEYGVNEVGIIIPRDAIVAALAAIRNLILDWSLRLEKSGIKGDDLSFSPEEKSKAHGGEAQVHIGSIGHFAGNIGSQSFERSSVQATQVDAGLDLSAVKELADQINRHLSELPNESEPAVRAELTLISDELGKSAPSQSKIRSALAAIGSVLKGAAGNLIASGILAELAKHSL